MKQILILGVYYKHNMVYLFNHNSVVISEEVSKKFVPKFSIFIKQLLINIYILFSFF